MGDEEIFLEATGLKYLTDEMLEAAYRVAKYLKRVGGKDMRKLGQRYSDVKITRLLDLREVALVIANVDLLLNRIGSSRSFTLREAADAWGVPPTIAKSYLEKAAKYGVVETVNVRDEFRYQISSKNLNLLIEELIEILEEIKTKSSHADTSKEGLSRLEKVKGGEVEEGEDSALDLNAIMSEMEDIIEKLASKFKLDSSLSVIQKVRLLSDVFGRELAIEIIDCIRLKTLVSIGEINVVREDLDKCRRILNEMRRLA